MGCDKGTDPKWPERSRGKPEGPEVVAEAQTMTPTRIREGFKGQRLVKCPEEVLSRCRTMALASGLHVTDIGHFPNTRHHYVSRPEGISNHIFIYNARGQGWVQLDGHRVAVPPEYGLVIPAGHPHTYGADNRLPWEIYWFHFNGMQAADVLEMLEISPERPLIFVPAVETLTEAFEDVFRWTRTGMTDVALIAMSAALLRFFSLVHVHRTLPGRKQRQTVGRINHVIHLMHEQLDTTRTLQEWARETHLSVPQFSMLFRRQTGTSPMRFLLHLRIQKACQLLDLTDMLIHEVANATGFEDALYFSRQFKQITGVSPRTYRQMVKG